MSRAGVLLIVAAVFSVSRVAEAGERGGFAARRGVDGTTRVIGYLGDLHGRGVLPTEGLRELARRWRVEKRLVNPVSSELLLADPAHVLHYEGLTEVLAGDVDGEAVSKWAERMATRTEKGRRERRSARHATIVPHRPMEFVEIEGVLRNIPIARLGVQRHPVTAAQWVSIMGDLPRSYDQRAYHPRWRIGRKVLQFEPESVLYMRIPEPDLVELLERLNARARPAGRRFDLPTDLEVEFLLRRASEQRSTGGSPSTLEVAKNERIELLHADQHAWAPQDSTHALARRRPVHTLGLVGGRLRTDRRDPVLRLVLRGAP
jgi:hypothetical protein